jgi:hypothetical protein
MASKHGVVSLTRTAALEYIKHGRYAAECERLAEEVASEDQQKKPPGDEPSGQDQSKTMSTRLTYRADFGSVGGAPDKYARAVPDGGTPKLRAALFLMMAAKE